MEPGETRSVDGVTRAATPGKGKKRAYGSPSTPAPVVATQDVSVVTVTEGTETVTVTK